MVLTRQDVLAPLERNPLELYLLGLCALSGGVGLLGVGTPSTSHLPPWADVAWYLLLLFGGSCGMAGVCWRDVLFGVLIERAAMWPVAAGAAMYAAAVAHAGQWLSALVLVGFGGAAAWRAWQITRLLRSHLRGGP